MEVKEEKPELAPQAPAGGFTIGRFGAMIHQHRPKV
jgi:hypothetical protein